MHNIKKILKVTKAKMYVMANEIGVERSNLCNILSGRIKTLKCNGRKVEMHKYLQPFLIKEIEIKESELAELKRLDVISKKYINGEL